MNGSGRLAPVAGRAGQRGERVRSYLVAFALGIGAMLAPPAGHAPRRPGIYRLLEPAEDWFDPRERVATGVVVTVPIEGDGRTSLPTGTLSLN
jgi:hypothetical protein